MQEYSLPLFQAVNDAEVRPRTLRRAFVKPPDTEALRRNASSISFNDFPFVSGMNMKHTMAVRRVHPPNKKYAPKLLFANRIGVVRATRKFVTQLLPCAMLVADARVLCG